MIIVCDSCSTSLQLDETKAPQSKFTIRCPKCKSLVSVNVGSQALPEKSASASAANYKPVSPAAQYKPAQGGAAKSASEAAPKAGGASEEFMRVLAGLLGKTGAGGFEVSDGEREKSVLLCLPPEHSEKTALHLSENGWHAYVAESVPQALETLSEIKIGNVVLAQNFAPEQKGSQWLQNHLFSLMPAVRRDIFLIYADERPQAAGNTNEAFLRNLNLIVNVKDLTNLSQILRRERRDFEDAYRFYKKALAGT